MGEEKSRKSRFLSDTVPKWPWLLPDIPTNRFGHDSSPECPACTGAEEDVEHAFFHCPRFLEVREALERALGERPSRDNIVGLMLESEEKWVAVGIAATNIMRELRRAERQRAGTLRPTNLERKLLGYDPLLRCYT